VQPEAVQPDAAQAAASDEEMVQAEIETPDVASSDVTDQPSPESAVAPEQSEPGASVIETEQSSGDSGAPVDVAASDGVDGDSETAAGDNTEQPVESDDAEAAPVAELVEPLENSVPVEPVAETLGQGEES
jgi:hypothetical protein